VIAERHRAPTPPPRALADATWAEVERGAAGRLLAVPVGSTEQHGRAPVACAERRLREEGRHVRAFCPRWPGASLDAAGARRA
jgi:hypothetical protein